MQSFSQKKNERERVGEIHRGGERAPDPVFDISPCSVDKGCHPLVLRALTAVCSHHPSPAQETIDQPDSTASACVCQCVYVCVSVLCCQVCKDMCAMHICVFQDLNTWICIWRVISQPRATSSLFVFTSSPLFPRNVLTYLIICVVGSPLRFCGFG